MRKQAPNIPHFLTKRQFAHHVGVSERTVSRWITSGDLRAHRFGSSVRIADDDANGFVAVRRG